MMRVAVTGGTGFVGRALTTALLERGHDVIALTRDPARAPQSLPHEATVMAWHPENGGTAPVLPEGTNAVVNLAGESIAAGRWTPQTKRRIYDSRMAGTRAIVAAMAQLQHPPSVLVNASAIGFYGDRGDEILTEESPPGRGFLARVVADWEVEAKRATDLGVRVVLLRTGVVLGRGGGALPRLALPFRMFAGGPVGSGSQWMSWVHLEDVVGLICFALEHDSVHGPVNAVAPEPLRNVDFSREVGRALNRPSWLPAPAFALRLALGEMADELLLSGQRVMPESARTLGYEFKHPAASEALKDALSS